MSLPPERYLPPDLWRLVDRVLWEEWDPIGVNAMGGPDDEYRSYVPRIVDLLRNSADKSTLVAELDDIAFNAMGIPRTDTSIAINHHAAASLLACLEDEG